MGYPLGSGGAVRTLGLWLFWLWVGGSLTAAVLCFFHAPMLTLAFFGALGIGFFGAMANAIDPINVPWGIAVCATVGMVGLAIAGPERECREPALGPSEAAGTG